MRVDPHLGQRQKEHGAGSGVVLGRGWGVGMEVKPGPQNKAKAQMHRGGGVLLSMQPRGYYKIKKAIICLFKNKNNP